MLKKMTISGNSNKQRIKEKSNSLFLIQNLILKILIWEIGKITYKYFPKYDIMIILTKNGGKI